VMDTDMTIACLRKNAARVVAAADEARGIPHPGPVAHGPQGAGWASPCMGAGVWVRGEWPLSSAGQRAASGVRDRTRTAASQGDRSSLRRQGVAGFAGLRGCGLRWGRPAPGAPPSPKRGRGRWPRVGPPTTPQPRNPAKHTADALPFPHIPS
jgi:hypothetical protein